MFGESSGVDGLRELLEQLEAQARAGEDVGVALCYLAVQQVRLDESELRAAVRRTLLVIAAGGDPTRELHPDDPPVARFAAELRTEDRLRELYDALRALSHAAKGLPAVADVAARLAADPEAAWRVAAAALLADELLERH